MSMDLKKLRYFIAVAEELHFNRAAKKLNMTQPPLSQQIQVLEEELGVKLFERTKRQVRITSAGAIFLEESKNIVAHLERSIKMTKLASEGKIGNLSITFVDSAAGGMMGKLTLVSFVCWIRQNISHLDSSRTNHL